MRKNHALAVARKQAARIIAMQVACPQCGAAIGDKCFGVQGARRQSIHRARTLVATSKPSPNVVMINRPASADRAETIMREGAEAAAVAVEETYFWAAEKCESPIEKIILAQFLHPHTGKEWGSVCEILFPPSGAIEHCQPPPVEGFYLWPQIKIGPYRVDFVVAAVRHNGEKPSYAVIECDGHDFHERTKDQAQRDKSRDRYLTGRGYRILRFTGSEIYRDPDAVWEEIFKIILGLCD